MAAVFGYGSLLALGGVRARLRGWTRTWNVCTDNTRNGPVHYENPSDGTRPPIQILFLTIEPAPDSWVDGAVIQVPDAELPSLDAREGNYDRIEVGVEGFGPAWTYVAEPVSAERARKGIAAGTARIRRDYLDAVVAAYTEAGLPAPSALPAPVVRLNRIRASGP
jgi:hypothetical protein